MKLLTACLCTCAAFACLQSGVYAQEEKKEAEKKSTLESYFFSPFLVVDQGDGVEDQRVYLYDISEDSITLRPDLLKYIGEYTLPLSIDKLFIRREVPERIRKLLNDFRRTSSAEGAERVAVVLRPFIYPMIRYLSIPAGKTNIHLLVNNFILGLKREKGPEQIIELKEILEAVDLKHAPPLFTQHALNASLSLLEKGKYEAATQLLLTVPITSDEKYIIEVALKIAEDLELASKNELAIKIYQKLENMGPSSIYELAILYLAYNNLELGHDEAVELYMDRTAGLRHDHPAYSLRQLILAKIYLEKKNKREAIRNVALSVTLGKLTDKWMPESLYLLGFCYEQFEQVKNATEIYKEIQSFYPGKKFAKLASARGKQLPRPDK